MSNKIDTKIANSISDYFKIIEEFISKPTKYDCAFYFRGENKDQQEKALTPSIYRDGLINSEEKIYREVSRYNNIDFSEDETTFDKLCRMQHYSAPTRLIDLSDDPLTALWFAINEGKKAGVVYLIKIQKSKIKYSDSDTVTVISNLAKIGLFNEQSEKSKQKIAEDVKFVVSSIKDINEFNSFPSIKYLLHEIRNDVNHFEPIINPKHISSIQCVKPKLTNSRLKNQKGAFLLFGLNVDDPKNHFSLIRKQMESENEYELNAPIFHNHPVEEILKIKVGGIDKTILSKIGYTQPSIYPEMDKVSEYFKKQI
jgi:hypothetical protein